MNNHKGQHPRFGATDVCPFIPIKDMTMDDAINLARELEKKYQKGMAYRCFYMKMLRQNQREKI